MKSLKELLEIKNAKHLNESFKSSILRNIFTHIDDMIDFGVSPFYRFDSKSKYVTDKSPIELVAIKLLENVANVYRDWLDEHEDEAPSGNDLIKMKSDIENAVSIDEINKAEREVFADLTENLNKAIDEYKESGKKLNDTNLFNDAEFKKRFAMSFSRNYNDKPQVKEVDGEPMKIRDQVKFNVNEITDDMFVEGTMYQFDSLKPQTSPMFITDEKDRLIGATIGHDILFAAEPDSVFEPNEEKMLSKMSLEYMTTGLISKAFLLQIVRPDTNDEKELTKYNTYLEDTKNTYGSIYDLYENGYKTYKPVSTDFMKITIDSIENYKSTKRIPSAWSPALHCRTAYDILLNYVEYILCVTNVASFTNRKYLKVINPYNFVVYYDCLRNVPGRFKYKDYVSMMKEEPSSKVYFLKPEVYKERKLKNSEYLEPVHKELLDSKKYKDRKEYEELLANFRNMAFNNKQRYKKTIKEKAASSYSDMFERELNAFMDKSNTLQNDIMKLTNVFIEMYSSSMNNIFTEKNVKNTTKKLNRMYDDTQEENDYVPDYVSRHEMRFKSNYKKFKTVKGFCASVIDCFQRLQNHLMNAQDSAINLAGILFSSNTNVITPSRLASLMYDLDQKVKKIVNKSLIDKSSTIATNNDYRDFGYLATIINEMNTSSIPKYIQEFFFKDEDAYKVFRDKLIKLYNDTYDFTQAYIGFYEYKEPSQNYKLRGIDEFYRKLKNVNKR